MAARIDQLPTKTTKMLDVNFHKRKENSPSAGQLLLTSAIGFMLAGFK